MYLYMVGASIRAQMQYRYAFVMNILGWAMTYAGTAITMWVLLYSFGAIEGWTFWELIFLFALAVLSGMGYMAARIQWKGYPLRPC